MKFQDLKKESMKDLDFKEEYERQSPYWKVQRQLIEARIKSKLTQEQIAQKMNVKQSAVARFEKSENNFNISTLIGYARAVGLSEIIIPIKP